MYDNTQLDCLFVVPNAHQKLYQGLADKYAAIEPPTWALLLASACRNSQFSVAILDCKAESLNYKEAYNRIQLINPRLVCIVAYGQNPSAGVVEMAGTIELSNTIKEYDPTIKICIVGSYPSALPKETLKFKSVDFVLIGEGVYAIQNLLKTNLKDHLDKVNGIGFKQDNTIHINKSQNLVTTPLMNKDLPSYAWDLLPYKSKPLDLYRSHMWHNKPTHRTPFAAIYTSLGCNFKCTYCMINIINRIDYSDHITSADSAGMRFWSPEHSVNEIEKLVKMGVTTIRLSDEMFFMNKKHYKEILKLLIERGLNKHINLWAYGRIDTIKNPENLELAKKAGINFIAIGIESASENIRGTIHKHFNNDTIHSIIKTIKSYDIGIVGDYIFGLPNDNIESMQSTLDLSLELLTEHWNAYAAYALPGSPLYFEAIKNNWELPTEFSEYSFFSYESKPLPTKYLTAAEVLRFRDNAFHTYFTHLPYLEMVEKKYGIEQRLDIENMSKIKLKRKLLGD